jgi:flagellar biosynthesis/type III secretory pathway chaperone
MNIYGEKTDIAKKLQDNMQDNHARWHVKSITEEKNEELSAKVDEVIGIIKGK